MRLSLHSVLALLALLAAGCTCGYTPTAEGALCDPGNVCPSGYLCLGGRCRTTSSTGGGMGGGAGGGGGAQGGGSGGGSALCTGVVCNMPPAAMCMGGNMLRTWAGACNPGTGACDYAPIDTACASGCQNAQCVGDPCAGITCMTPPAPACGAGGVVTSSLPGTCSAGTCKYNEMVMACPNGCANATCVPAPASFGQVLPRVRHPITAVDQRPVSAGDDVLVVGPAGAVSRWNGTGWSPVDAGTQSNLAAVWWAPNATGGSGPIAYMVAETNLLRMTPDGVVTRSPTFPPVVANGRLVDVHGIDPTNLAVVDNAGTVYRFASSAWVPTTRVLNAPYRMVGVWMEPAAGTFGARLRYYGACNGGCVVYQSGSGGYFDNRDTAVAGFRSAGPSLDGEGYLGLDIPQVRRHVAGTGLFDSVNTPTGMDGGAVVAMTGGTSATRSTFVLTAPTTSQLGHLYRVTTGMVPLTPTVSHLLEVFYGYQAMSKTESAGVIVVDMNTSTNTSTITRRGAVANEVLDLGAEDWVAGDAYPAGSVLLNAYGDVAIRPNGSATFQLRRFPADISATAIAGGSSYAVLTATDGSAWRIAYAANSTYAELVFASPPAGLTSVCRVSDAEWYLGGKGGGLYSYDGNSTRQLNSNTTATLEDLDCVGPGSAVACGAGTVMRLQAGTWTALPNVPTGAITRCQVVNGAVFIGGPNLFARFVTGAWVTMPARPALDGLVVRSVNEAYAAQANVIYRFDGTQWLSAATAPQALLTGFQMSSRVAFAGAGGVVMEGQ